MTLGFDDDVQTIGERSDDQIAEYLKLIGDHAQARDFMPAIGAAQSLLPKKVWQHGNHLFGFIPPGARGGLVEILPAATVAAQTSLKGKRVKVVLDKLRVANYPGWGEHKIVVEFRGRNQGGDAEEDLHFASTYRASDSDSAGINGHPIFVGLTVPSDGLAFSCRTVNVTSKGDTGLVELLESEPFKQGLGLITQSQPALKPFVTLTRGLVTMAAKRTENVAVQTFSLGLDFSTITTSVRLAIGSYVAIQAPEDDWDWSRWRYDTGTMGIVPAQRGGTLPYNYMIFSVAPYDGNATGTDPARAFGLEPVGPAKSATQESERKPRGS